MSSPPGDKVAGTLRVPSGGNGTNPAAEIETEIADHLATSAEQLHAQGLPTDLARQKSHEKFGDAATISRRCYWIKQGDTLMFRAALILLLSVLCLGLGIAVFSSYRSQTQMAGQMAALAEQLKALAEQQRTAPAPAQIPGETKPLEITGSVFLGSPDKPFANAEIMVCRVADGEVVRRVSTLADGTFRSGPLTAGDYSLLVKDSREYARRTGTQTAPIYVYPGAQPAPIKIDAALQAGQIAVKLSRPLPKLKVEGKYTIDSRLSLEVSLPRVQRTRWTAARPTPERWPIYIELAEGNPNPSAATGRGGGSSYDRSARAVVSNEDLAENSSFDFLYGRDRHLPTGPCSVSATIVADVLPEDSKLIDRNGTPQEHQQWMSANWVLNETMGATWHAKLLQGRRGGPPGMNRDFRGSFSTTSRLPDIEVVQGEETVIQIDVPDDIVSRIQSLLETVTDPNEFREAVAKENPFVCKAQVYVVGHQPLSDS